MMKSIEYIDFLQFSSLNQLKYTEFSRILLWSFKSRECFYECGHLRRSFEKQNTFTVY
jgi:hypothetical protein